MHKTLPDADRAAQDAVLRAAGEDLKRAFGAVASATLPPELAAELRAVFPAARRGPAHNVFPHVPAELRTVLQDALVEFFEDSAVHAMPSAVTIIVTNGYNDGPAWNTYGATLHYGPDVTVEAPGFERTFVADALVEISDDEQPYGTPCPVLFVPLPA
ncbi:hypothetical protein MHW47_00085 [Streptomyces sp. OfavH-34-F]|uniref:hypothetical protein n=1 Tax=Streptomyces sp. OfavH-34-F TaxID=2917760 RepID=UPI001EF17626|nr:hypothetical protein [Streptomyces sp. OfavH-34-F]MCG7522853.1 hypothetical protein [Streptomyces sp. OfavH-34-F]